MEKNNKYSIRKFTVGTGSIIIGAVIFLSNPGISKAAENIDKESNSSIQQKNTGSQEQASVEEGTDEKEQASDQEGTDTKEQASDQEGTDTKEQASDQEGTDEKEQASDQEGTDEKEQAPGQEGTDTKEQAPGQEGTDEKEQATGQEDTNAKEQSSDQEGTDEKEQASDQEGKDEKEQAPVQEGTDEKEQASDQEDTDEKEQATGQEDTNAKEQSSDQEGKDEKEQALDQEDTNAKEQSSEEEGKGEKEQASDQESTDEKEQAPDQEDTNAKEQSSDEEGKGEKEQPSEEKGANAKEQSSNEDETSSKEHIVEQDSQNTPNSKTQTEKKNDVNKITDLNLQNKNDENINLTKKEYENLQNESSKQEKTNNNLKTANVMNTKVKEEAGKEENVAKDLGGDNVNDKVKASNVKFTDGTWKKGSLNQIGFDLTIPEGVKRNDYFTVKVPKELNPTSADRDNGILLGNDENSIYAKGTYNRENNAFDFKFTDNVEKYKNKTSHVDLMALINYKEATKTDDYNLQLQVGNQEFVEKRKIEYSSDARNTMVYQDSGVQEKDGNHNPYSTTYTINGQSKSLSNAKVKITPYLGSQKSADTISQFNKNTTKVSILKVNDKSSMNQSGSEKNVNTNDESSKYQVTYNSDGSLSIDFGNITGPYLIKINSETDRPFVPNTFVESNVQLSASNISTQNSQSKIGKAKPSNSNSSGVVVDDTTAPVVTPINNQTNEVNTPIDTITINANDNSGKPVKNDVYGLPDGVTFDSETNTISGTPTKPGKYNVTVITSDHVYNETKTDFDINVEDTTAPDVDDVDDQTKEVNTPIDEIHLNGSDNSKGTITHEVNGLPDGVTYDSETNTISGTPTKVGKYPVTVTTKDESGNTTETDFDINVEDTTAPDVDDVDDQTKEVNTPIDEIHLNGSDNSKGTITHEVNGLPDGVTYDSETNTISGTPIKVGKYPVTVTTKDESGNTTKTDFDINVEDTTAPDVDNVDDQTKEVNTPIDEIHLNGSDNSKGAVTHEVNGLPDGVTYDSETNTISGAPTKVGKYPITVTTKDESGNTTETDFDINVEDTTAPDVDDVDDQTKEVNTPIDEIHLNGSDNSKGAVTHEVNGLPDGVTYDSETNTISGTPTKVGKYPITVTTKDELGNTTEMIFNINVEDTTPSDDGKGDNGSTPSDGGDGNNGSTPSDGGDGNNGSTPSDDDDGNNGSTPSDDGNEDNGATPSDDDKRDNVLTSTDDANGVNGSTPSDDGKGNSSSTSSANGSMDSNIDTSNKENKDHLPDTGEKVENKSQSTIFGGIIAMIGSLLLFTRRKKNNKE